MRPYKALDRFCDISKALRWDLSLIDLSLIVDLSLIRDLSLIGDL